MKTQLTAEILEHNGFMYVNDEYSAYYLDKLELIEREPYNGLQEFEVVFGKQSWLVHYVEELQNILITCKIDKNIELC